MHIRKYDHDYSRRFFMEQTARGVASAGVLGALWPLVAKGADIGKAYPDELMSIEAYTKGKIKTGDMITADNVEVVKALVDPTVYHQVKNMGRRIRIVPTTRDVSKLFPADYLQATLRNAGKAKFDADGNVVGADGKSWTGGNPFPDAKSGIEAAANLTLSWGRHDNSTYAVRDWEVAQDGSKSYSYDFVWVEVNTQSRADGRTFKGMEDKLRLQSLLFTGPSDIKGTSYLNTWYYDQRKFPDLVGYLPAFKRVRKFPTNQRFEPVMPGSNLYLSDAWGAGDPMLTWGNYKLVGRGPFLGAVSQNWHGEHANWEPPLHGGAKGETFFDTNMELCPDVLVFEAEPIGFPRAPVGKKRVWVDARNMLYIAYVTYDRRGEIFKSFEPAYSTYEKGDKRVADGKSVAWSWTKVHSFNMQDGRMTRLAQVKSVAGGYQTSYVTDDTLVEKFLTEQALQRLGS